MSLAVEASGGTWAFVDQIVDQVTRVCIVDPGKTRLKAGFAAKTDRLDATRLADALRAEDVIEGLRRIAFSDIRQGFDPVAQQMRGNARGVFGRCRTACRTQTTRRLLAVLLTRGR